MFNVDTITLGMNLEDKTLSYTDLVGNIRLRPDYNYIKRVEVKIKSRLYMDSNNRKKETKATRKAKMV